MVLKRTRLAKFTMIVNLLKTSNGATIWTPFPVIVWWDVVETYDRIFEITRVIDRISQEPKQISSGNVVIVIHECVKSSLRRKYKCCFKLQVSFYIRQSTVSSKSFKIKWQVDWILKGKDKIRRAMCWKAINTRLEIALTFGQASTAHLSPIMVLIVLL